MSAQCSFRVVAQVMDTKCKTSLEVKTPRKSQKIGEKEVVRHCAIVLPGVKDPVEWLSFAIFPLWPTSMLGRATQIEITL